MQRVRFIRVLITVSLWGAAALLAAPDAAAGDRVVVDDGPITFLGIGTSRADDGLRVTHVTRGSGADTAGLRRGDVIVAFDGHDVDSSFDLRDLVRALRPGDAAEVTVERDGRRESLTATLGERDEGPRLRLDDAYWVWSPHMRGRVQGEIGIGGHHGTALEDIYLCPEGESCGFSREPIWYRADCVGRGCPTFEVRYFDRPMLGVEIVETTPELSRHLGGDRATRGVLIGRVMDASPAEAAGVAVGDLIVAVGGEAIDGRRELSRAIRDAAAGAVELEVVRDGRSRRLSAWIEAAGPAGPVR